MPTNTELTNRISETLARGATTVLVTIIESTTANLPVGIKMTVLDNGERLGTLGDSALDEYVIRESGTFLKSRDTTKVLKRPATSEGEPTNVKILFERIETEPRLVIAGAGHVGAALARLAAIAGFRVTLIDDRAEFVARELFSSPREESIELAKADDWQDAMR